MKITFQDLFPLLYIFYFIRIDSRVISTDCFVDKLFIIL